MQPLDLRWPAVRTPLVTRRHIDLCLYAGACCRL
ncbi:putative leader peptide [Streptomyces sp. BH106]